MDCTNTLLDDICAEIGYTATTLMTAWYGGKIVHVPNNVIPKHVIGRIIGEPAFVRLVAAFPGHDLFIPKNAVHQRVVRWRAVRDMLLAGHDVRTVSEETCMTSRSIHKIRRRLEDLDLLPVILTKPAQHRNVD